MFFIRNIIHTTCTSPLSHLGRGCRVVLALLTLCLALASCAEEDDTVNEYANWQQRNDEYFEKEYQAAVAKINAGDKSWRLVRMYSKVSDDICKHTDFVIVHVISQNEAHDDSNDSYTADVPEYTDSVMVHYRGTLMPTPQHPDGFQFDSSYIGDYNLQTMIPSRFTMKGGAVVGFLTALQKMHVGDRWQVTIPYSLGYNATPKTNLPAYSTLNFDLTLSYIGKPGKKMPNIW